MEFGSLFLLARGSAGQQSAPAGQPSCLMRWPAVLLAPAYVSLAGLAHFFRYATSALAPAVSVD